MNVKQVVLRLGLVVAVILLAACGTSESDQSRGEPTRSDTVEITGAGASFVFPIMSKWSQSYSVSTGNRINYQSIGSGGGIAQIKANTVDFGSSDKPLSPAELAEAKLGQFPSVIGGVVPVINIDGVKPGQLRLTGETLANIYAGKISKWNDPRIIEINNDLLLPDSTINVVFRSDGSGTTFNFANYLSKISATWSKEIGEGTALKFPVGVGGKGNEGVAAYVAQLNGSIGYVELSYAMQNQLAYVSLKNAAGNWVQPSNESFQAAAANANWATSEDFYLIITNAPGEQAWPIAATNFILMAQRPRDLATAKAALEYFRWTYTQGDDQANKLGYVPLPDELVAQIEAYWTKKFTY